MSSQHTDRVAAVEEKIDNNHKAVVDRLDTIEEKIDSIAVVVQGIKSNLRKECEEAKNRFGTLKKQMDALDAKVDQLQASVDSVKEYVKDGYSHISAMESDFKGALRHLGNPGSANKYGQFLYAERDKEEIEPLARFIKNLAARLLSESDQISHPDGPSELFYSWGKTKVRLSGIESLSLDDISREIERKATSNAPEFKAKIEEERDNYIDMEIHRAAMRFSSEARSLSELSGKPLKAPEVCRLHEKLVDEFREAGWGESAEKIVSSGLARLANGQEIFREYAMPNIKAKLSEITEGLQDEVAKKRPLKGGLFQSLKSLSPFRESEMSVENGSLKSLFKAKNAAHLAKTIVGGYLSKKIDDLSLTDAVQTIRVQLQEVHDYQEAMGHVADYVSSYSDDPFGCGDDEADTLLFLDDPEAQWDTNSDAAKDMVNRAFAIAFSKMNPDQYQHISGSRAVTREEQERGKRIVELCAVLGSKTAEAYLNGGFQMNFDATQSIVMRFRDSGHLDWLAKSSGAASRQRPEPPLLTDRDHSSTGLAM